MKLHYGNGLSPEKLIENVCDAYPEGTTIYQLAPIDQLHTGGIKASQRLCNHLPAQAATILDIGCGLGGLMRLFAQNSQHTVVGLDITHTFNIANKALHQLTSNGLRNGRITTADAQQLPFAANCFDQIFCQHSLLNVPNTEAALTECHRVLKPSGSLILHELVASKNVEKMEFPVPWAADQTQSHLTSIEYLKDLIHAAQFQVERCENLTEQTLGWRNKQAHKEVTPGRGLLSPKMVLGDAFPVMAKNLQINLKADAIAAYEIVTKPVVLPPRC